jgi:hypothetical protein
MWATRLTKKFVPIYKTAWNHITDDINLNSQISRLTDDLHLIVLYVIT